VGRTHGHLPPHVPAFCRPRSQRFADSQPSVLPTLDGGRKVVGIEVKAGATVHDSDFRGLRRLQSHAGKRFTRGVVLYDGETCASFGDGMHVVPIRALWEKLPV
jgi:hypothetical protein